MSKEALQQMVDAINSNKRIRCGVDHRRDFPPKGRFENAELVERDGYYYVHADIKQYPNIGEVEWRVGLVKEYFDDTFQFAEVEQEEAAKNSVSFDFQNFPSVDDAKKFSEVVRSQRELDSAIKFHGRKSLIPDPEIIIQLAATGLVYQFLKPVAKSIGENIAQDFSKEAHQALKKSLGGLSRIIREAVYRTIPKTRPVSIVLDFPGKPHIELIAKTRDEKKVLTAMTGSKLQDIRNDLMELGKHVEIAKAQYLLNAKGKWEFNYLITSKGEAIGKKSAFQRRDRRLQMISELQKSVSRSA